MYQRVDEIVDELVDGMDVLLLVGSRLVRGSIITRHILHMCSEPASIDEIVEQCRATFGEPPEGNVEDLVSDALKQLEDVGVLESTQ